MDNLLQITMERISPTFWIPYVHISCVVTLPGATTKAELAIEGDLYGLGDLVRTLRMPIIDLSE
jgi:hypothetical protein